MKFFIVGILISQSVFASNFSALIKAFDTDKIKTNAVIVDSSSGVLGEYLEVRGMEERKFQLWSISKTIGALLIGRAIDDGNLKLDEVVRDNITIKDLLQMSSGIDWDESYEEAPFKSNVVRMLYGPESVNMGEYVLNRPVKHQAGKRFKYSSGDSNLLQWYLKKKLGSEYALFPWKSLFDPMEIKATFETDSTGVYVASSYAYMSPTDLLKIAKLILQKGNWNGVQLLSNEFVEKMITPSESSVTKSKFRPDDLNYGFQIWLNAKSSDGKIPLKDLPENSIFLLGHHGQIVGIFPNEQLIILRSAYDRGRLDKNRFFKEIIEWAKKQNSL